MAFENQWVQVVNVHYGPHEKFTRHDRPGGVVVILTGGHLKFTDQNRVAIEVFAKPGESHVVSTIEAPGRELGRYIGIKGNSTPVKAGLERGQPTMDAKTRQILTGPVLALAKRQAGFDFRLRA